MKQSQSSNRHVLGKILLWVSALLGLMFSGGFALFASPALLYIGLYLILGHAALKQDQGRLVMPIRIVLGLVIASIWVTGLTVVALFGTPIWLIASLLNENGAAILTITQYLTPGLLGALVVLLVLNDGSRK